VHNSFKNGVLLLLARLLGVPIRVCHSHTSGLENKLLLPIFSILKLLAIKSSNVHVACGQEAGKFLFGKQPFLIINNAISVSTFLLNNVDLIAKKKQFSLPINKRLIVHVGRFSTVKNHQFIIELVKSQQLDEDIHFVFVGEGPLKLQLTNYIIENQLVNKISVLPATKEVPHLLKCATGFIMPSLFEGVSVALLEA